MYLEVAYMSHWLHTSKIPDMFLWQYHLQNFHQPNSLSIKQKKVETFYSCVPILNQEHRYHDI